MTGEITLSGYVLPVGGIMRRSCRPSAKIDELILPAQMRRTSERTSSRTIVEIKIHYVKTIEEVLRRSSAGFAGAPGPRARSTRYRPQNSSSDLAKGIGSASCRIPIKIFRIPKLTNH
jgi:hypothetical protein